MRGRAGAWALTCANERGGSHMSESYASDERENSLPVWAQEPQETEGQGVQQETVDGDKQLIDELMKASRLMRQRMHTMGDERREAQERTNERNRVLKLLALKPRMEQKEIADLMGVRLRALDELLGEMESQHLVTREQPDEPDMRIVVVELTDEGREAGSTDDTVTEPQLVPELDEDDRSKLVDLLKVLNAQFEAMGLRDEDRGGRGGFRGGTRGGRTERRGTFRGEDRGSRDDRRDGGRGGFRGSRDERGGVHADRGKRGGFRDDRGGYRSDERGGFRDDRKGWRGERGTRSARYDHNERSGSGHRGHTGGFGARSGRGFGSSN